MSRKHNTRIGIWIESCYDITMYVRALLIGVELHFFTNDLLDSLFEARGTWAIDQPL